MSNGTFTVTGSGDIGPVGAEVGQPVERVLIGLAIGLLIVIVVAVRFVSADDRLGAPPLAGPVLAASAVVIGAVAFVAGLVAAAVVPRPSSPTFWRSCRCCPTTWPGGCCA